jgi:hypothetical protein
LSPWNDVVTSEDMGISSLLVSPTVRVEHGKSPS